MPACRCTRSWTTRPRRRRLEQTHYPRSGEPNPKVRFGVVASAGGPVQWADLSDYSADSFLISDVGWWPDSSAAYCYVQNRIQTWLDFVKFTPGEEKGSVKRLFRDQTKAWIESPGPVHWLDDGTFLWLSERDGWKHLYHYDAAGNQKAQLTSGPWEVRGIEHVDSKNGWIYFSGTRDNPVATNFYRAKPGGPVERLTQTSGSHDVSMSPDGKLFLSSWSDIKTPTRQRLYGADGRLVRTIDSNPSHELKRLRFGPRERLQIPARDGFLLEAELILPPDLDTEQEVPGLVQDLRRPACAHGLGLVGRRPDVGPGAGPRGIRRLPHGPAQRQRQGSRLGLVGLQAPGRPGARGHQGRDQLAQAEALCRRLADRHGRA